MTTPRSGSPRRLVVEGKDDMHVVIHLGARCGFSLEEAGVFVHDAGSVEQAIAQIGLGVKTYQRFGVLVDGDDLPARWRQVRSAF